MAVNKLEPDAVRLAEIHPMIVSDLIVPRNPVILKPISVRTHLFKFCDKIIHVTLDRNNIFKIFFAHTVTLKKSNINAKFGHLSTFAFRAMSPFRILIFCKTNEITFRRKIILEIFLYHALDNVKLTCARQRPALRYLKFGCNEP